MLADDTAQDGRNPSTTDTAAGLLTSFLYRPCGVMLGNALRPMAQQLWRRHNSLSD
jgi:hypothetical protein